MKISVVGTGYVGLVSGTCFAEMGNSVICVDRDESKIEMLNRGEIPIYEPGLEEMVRENRERGSLTFTTDLPAALEKSDILFIAVGTPMGEDGSADLSHVLGVAETIGNHMTHDMIIVDKSTVPVGTADMVRETIETRLSKRGVNHRVSVVSNPEFLKEGAAVDDAMRPDRVVIGTDNEQTLEVMKELYRPFTRNHERFISMDIRSAEMTKYAANAMLATKISFMNEIARICERVGADVNMVRVGIGSDTRIGYSFIYPGVGYGGSCFPKDVQALIRSAHDYGYEPSILEAVEEVNRTQREYFVKMILDRYGSNVRDRTFALWGLAFKPETDDMREAPSVTIIEELTRKGARIRAYDPKAMEEAREFYLRGNDSVEYFDSKYAVLAGADALILVTEWKEFRSPDFDEIQKALKEPVIFDGRNQYNRFRMEERGFEYHQVGVAEKRGRGML